MQKKMAIEDRIREQLALEDRQRQQQLALEDRERQLALEDMARPSMHKTLLPVKSIYTVDMGPPHMCSRHRPGHEKETAPLEQGPDGFVVAVFPDGIHTTELANLILCGKAKANKKNKKKKGKKDQVDEEEQEPQEQGAPKKKGKQFWHARNAEKAEKKKTEKASDKIEQDKDKASRKASGKAPIKKKPKAPIKKKPAAAPAVLAVPAEAAAAAVPEADKKDYGVMHYSTKGKNTIGIRARFGKKNQVLSFGSTRCTKSAAEMRSIARECVASLQEGISANEAKLTAMRACGL